MGYINILLLLLLFMGIWKPLDLQNVADEDAIKIEKPKDAVFYKRLGTMYPSVNLGHIRITVDVASIEEIGRRICRHSLELHPYENWTNLMIIQSMGTAIQE